MKQQSQKLFAASLGGLIFALTFGSSGLHDVAVTYWIGHFLYILFIGMAVLRIFCSSYRSRVLALFILAVIPVVINLSFIKDHRCFLYIPLLILACRGMSYKDVLRAVLIGSAFGILFVFGAYLAGFIDTVEKVSNNNILGIKVFRNSFGFLHQNQAGCYFLIFFLSYMYLRWNKFGFRDYAFWLASAMFLFFVISTKTAALVVFGGILFRLASGIIPRRSVRAVLVAASVLAVLAAFLLPVYFDKSNEILSKINYLMTNRLSLAHSFLDVNDIGLFRHELIQFDTKNEKYLDNGYLYLLITQGAVVFAVFSAAYIAVFTNALRRKDTALLFVLAAVFAIGNMEHWIFDLFPYIVFPVLTADMEDEGLIRINLRFTQAYHDGCLPISSDNAV